MRRSSSGGDSNASSPDVGSRQSALRSPMVLPTLGGVLPPLEIQASPTADAAMGLASSTATAVGELKSDVAAMKQQLDALAAALLPKA